MEEIIIKMWENIELLQKLHKSTNNNATATYAKALEMNLIEGLATVSRAYFSEKLQTMLIIHANINSKVLPTNIDGWTLYKGKDNKYRLNKRINGRMYAIYIGQYFDEQEARTKIRDWNAPSKELQHVNKTEINKVKESFNLNFRAITELGKKTEDILKRLEKIESVIFKKM